MIFVIKVTTNKEERALEMISDKVRKKSLAVYSLTRPHGLRLKKTVRGEEISDKTSQINLNVLKEGAKKFDEICPVKPAKPKWSAPKVEEAAAA